MTTFYFVRHGQTTLNVINAFNGGLSEPPLTDKGKQDAITTGKALAHLHFTQVLTSSMARAMTTTQLIMQENQYSATTLVQPVDALREIVQGQWDGKTEAQADDPERINVYLHDPERFDAEFADSVGVEHYHHVLARTRAVIDAATAAHPSGDILVVGHGIALLVVINDLLGYPLNHVRQVPKLKNAAITVLQTRNGGTYRRLCDNMSAPEFAAQQPSLT